MTSLFLAILFLLSSSSSCRHPSSSSDTFRGLVAAPEKTRLGSTPPSCHNKCNQCHPCMAVQVPTLPSHNAVDPTSLPGNPLDYSETTTPSSLSVGNRYSNYKPLGWKCRCDGHFYNP